VLRCRPPRLGGARRRNSSPPTRNTRVPFERHIFTVTVGVPHSGREGRDFHIVLRAGHPDMIAEAPNALLCTPHATVYRKLR
jgi:hypothetical protein